MDRNYKELVSSLKLLASSLEVQKQYLPDFADIPDDVTSSFENVFLLLPVLIDNNRITNTTIASVLRVYNKMQWCLRNIDLDDFDSEEWNKVRAMAQNTLHIMGESVEICRTDGVRETSV